jgi:hypothetical protein
MTKEPSQVEQLSLQQATTALLEECRMVLPGVQALFGFQFIAVFNDTFRERLSSGEKTLHLVALFCVACSAALVMSPAALQRITHPRSVTSRYLEWAGRMLMCSMPLLALGTTFDVYIVAHLITQNGAMSAAMAVAVFLVFGLLWFVLPNVFRKTSP